MGFDYSQLNIRDNAGNWLCPSCGFDGAFNGTSFCAEGPIIGTAICPCGLYEPGYDDVAAASGTPEARPIDALRAYSLQWRDGEMRWRGTASSKPKGWDASAQFSRWVNYCQQYHASAPFSKEEGE